MRGGGAPDCRLRTSCETGTAGVVAVDLTRWYPCRMQDGFLRRFAMVMLVGYAAQFAVGMLLNLFVTIPDAHPGTSGDEYFSRSFTSLAWALSGAGGVALFIHALLGSALFAGAVALFVASLVRRAHGWRWLTGVAAFFTFGAFFNGMSFLDYGEDFSSAIMAGCWLIATGAVVIALVRRPRRNAAAKLPETPRSDPNSPRATDSMLP